MSWKKKEVTFKTEDVDVFFPVEKSLDPQPRGD